MAREFTARIVVTSAARVCQAAVQQIEYPHGFGEERIVATRLLPSAFEHGLEHPGVGDRDAADVEKMPRCRNRAQGRIVVQAEARRQHLEGHAAFHVREVRTVVIEAERRLWALAWPRNPQESCLAIDEPLDEPRARQAVDPWRLARCPDALLVSRTIELAQAPLGEARLAAGEKLLIGGLQRRDGVRRLGFCGSGEKVDARQLFHGTLEPPERRQPAARAELGQRLLQHRNPLHEIAVLGAAVKELADVGSARLIARLELARQGKPAVGADVGLDLREWGRIARCGQDVHAIAQHTAAGILERAPEAHAQRRIARGQAEDQGGEAFHWCYIYHMEVTKDTDFY